MSRSYFNFEIVYINTTRTFQIVILNWKISLALMARSMN